MIETKTETKKNPLELIAERITQACGIQVLASDLEYNGYNEKEGTYWSALVKPATPSEYYSMIAVYFHEKKDQIISWSTHSVK